MTGMDDVARRGLVLLGCGRMGGAMLNGWLKGGLPPAAVWVLDPAAGPALADRGVRVNAGLPEGPAVCVLAVKPQIMEQALPAVTALGGGGTLVLSIAAGVTLGRLGAAFGPGTPIVRAMPNTPAAIGQGISALIGNAEAGEPGLALAETLLAVIGETVRLTEEGQMDAVTAVSGSGPAYVFHMIECLARAGEAEGLPGPLALRLAVATVAGAGALAARTGRDPAELRAEVTSPGGTTAAGLVHLMDAETGLCPLIGRTVAAAAERSRELGRAAG